MLRRCTTDHGHSVPPAPHALLWYTFEMAKKIARTSRKMLNETSREPTPEELAETLGMPIEKLRRVLKLTKEPLFIEAPVGDEKDARLGDFIEDKPIEAAIQSDLRETTRLACLPRSPGGKNASCACVSGSA
jgi:DNA-directed RNA polymerase specialized sigma subunit